MKIDISTNIPDKVTSLFNSDNELTISMQCSLFSEFADEKRQEPSLSFDLFLKTKSATNDCCYTGIKQADTWVLSDDRNVIVSFNDRYLKYALVTLEVLEVETKKIFKLGTDYIVTSDDMIYSIK